jgi:hypothetical protein
MPQPDIDRERLTRATSENVGAITSDGFVEAMTAVSEAPADQRLAEATRRLSPDALRGQGIQLRAADGAPWQGPGNGREQCLIRAH